jgi:DNA-binding winged helix-turn-helix (wHTH) protein/formylglycine-generating enzyme required for sulfatase activity
MTKANKHLYKFGPFLLDPAEHRLLRDDTPVPLTPKAFDMLLVLVKNQGRLLEKDELMRELWPDTFVEEGNLAFNVSTLRKALGEEQSEQRYIETVPKKGYRFAAQVTELTPETPDPAEAASVSREASSAETKRKESDVGGKESLDQAARVAPARLRGLPRPVLWGAVGILALTVAATPIFRHLGHLKWARESATRVQTLAQVHRYFEAYDLAVAVRKYLPNEPAISQLMGTISDDLSVSTDPPGAQIYLKRFSPDASGNFPPRQFVGTTPISRFSIAHGAYLVDIEKDGYAPVRRTISSDLNRAVNPTGMAQRSLIQVEQKLIEADKVPDRVVFVPGGPYKLISYGRPTDATAQLDDYFIDKFEVTNREYKEFINAGGYLKKEYWKYTFIKDGKRLTWEDAMQQFKDRTGLPGPRSWVGQDYQEGKGEYPVTDVGWYEAAAYAAFRGKQLPTVFQWEKASRIGMPATYPTFLVALPGPYSFGGVLPWGLEGEGGVELRANFNSRGTLPVDRFDFGASPSGAYNMAGNVSEWLVNEKGDGFLTAGGSWGDPPYTFGYYGEFPGLYSSDKLGFRCARVSPHVNGDQGAMRFSNEQIPTYTPTSGASFRAWLSHYRYDKTPLRPKLEEVDETKEWRREKITYMGANDARATAYLYLPKNVKPPFQVIHYIPGSSAFRSLAIPQFEDLVFSPHIKAGRAVFVVVLEGYVERKWPAGYESPDISSVKFRAQVVNWVTDLRRGLDYLGTRNDVDISKVAFWNKSQVIFVIVPAVESRYRSVILESDGVAPRWLKCIPEANPISFAPHIAAPKVMISGRYDEVWPFKSASEPLYKLLSEPKRLEVFNGGHSVPLELSVPIVNTWLDKTLGPIEHK